MLRLLRLQLLEETNSDHYTYSSSKDKPKGFMAKGLSWQFTEQDIADDLNQKCPQDVEILSIKNFQTRASKGKGTRSNLFTIFISGTSNPKSFLSIKSILNCKISLEPLKKRQDVIQCRVCQRFGHVGANCSMQPRCIKCAEAHHSYQCTLNGENDKTDESLLKCAGCGENHTANYRQCKIRINFIERRNKNSTKNKPENVSKNQSNKKDVNKEFITQNQIKEIKTYAEALQFKTNIPNNNNKISNSRNRKVITAAEPGFTRELSLSVDPTMDGASESSNIFSDCEELFGFSFFGLLVKTKRFNIEYKKLKHSDKPKAIVQFAIGLLCHNGP